MTDDKIIYSLRLPTEAIRQLELLSSTDNETASGLARKILLEGIEERIKRLMAELDQEPAREPQR